MTDLRLNIRLTADGKLLAAEVQRSSTAVQGLERTAAPAARELRGMGQAAGTTNVELQKVGSSAGVASKSFAEVGKTLAAAFAADRVYEVGKAIAEITTRADALSRGLAAALGTQSAGAAGLTYVNDVAERLGLRLQATGQQFQSFAASTRGTRLEGAQTQAVFEGVGEAAVALGLDAEKTGQVFVALAQMASKGTVASEELKGQLGEALPGAFNLAAQALGVTTARLQEMLDRGEVLAEDLLPKLAARLHQQYGPAAAQAARGAQQEWARFTTAVERSAAAFGSGWLDDAATSVRHLTDAIRAPETEQALRRWGERFGELIRLADQYGASLAKGGVGGASGASGVGGAALGTLGDTGVAGAAAREAQRLRAQLAAMTQAGPKSSGLFGVTDIDRAAWREDRERLVQLIATVEQDTVSRRENEEEVHRHAAALAGWRQVVIDARRDLDTLDAGVRKATQGLATAASAQDEYQQKTTALNAAYGRALAEAAAANDMDRYRKLLADYGAANAELTAKLGEQMKAVYARTDRLNSLAQDGTLSAARARYQAELDGIEARERTLEQQFGVHAGAARQRWLSLAAEVERKYALPAGLLGATMHVESNFDPLARSGAGAIGLMQLMPTTARGLGVEPRDPEQAIEGAGRYYRQLLGMVGGDLNSAVAAYNWGPGALRANGLDAAPAETRAHVKKVLAAIPQYRAANDQLLAVDQDYTQAHTALQQQRQAAESRWIDVQIQALEQQREQRRAAGALTVVDEAETNNRIAELQQQRVANERATTTALNEQARAAAYARAQVLAGLDDDLARLQAEALPTAAAQQAVLLQLDQQRRRQQALAQVRGDAVAVAQAQATLDRIDQLEQAAVERRAHPLRELAEDWADAAGQMERASVGWANSTASAIAQFVATGKADFRSLAASIVQDLIRIQIQQQATPVLGWLGQAITSAAGSLFGAPAANVNNFSAAAISGPVTVASVHHTGGLAGTGIGRAVTPALFERAPRYHTGGIAGFAPDEVPAILQRGEEVLPRTDPRHRDYAGAGGVTVSQSITIDARGADAGAEARIRAALDQYRRQTVADILQSLQRGGAFARATGRA